MSACRGLTSDFNVMACANGTIQSSTIACDTYCVNPNCPTVVNCGKGIVHDSKIICLSYDDQNAHIQAAKVKGAAKLANKSLDTTTVLNLGTITKTQDLNFQVPIWVSS